MTRAERLWRLDRERARLSATLHRATTRMARVKEEATRLRVSMTQADRAEYDVRERLSLHEEAMRGK